MRALTKVLLLFAATAACTRTPHALQKPHLLSRPLKHDAAAQLAPLRSSPISRLRGGGAVGWASVTPPIVALVASVALQQVIVALLLGIYVGCLVLSGGAPVQALLRVFDTYLIRAFNAEGHAGVLLFTFLLGGTIGLVQKAGGGLALALLLQRYMKSAKSALLSAWALCGLIFFDDYSSVLIVGNSLRPALAALGVAAERFAVVVHTMGVTLASLAPVSSWVGLQIGYVASLFDQLGLDGDPFVFTMRTLPYRFLPLFATLMLPLFLVSGRDFGPLAAWPNPSPAAAAAASIEADGGVDAGPLEPKPGTKLRAVNALLPFATIVAVTFGGMLADGASKLRAKDPAAALTLVAMLSESDSINGLIWASASGWLVTMFMVVGQRILDLHEAMDAWMIGMKDVLEPTFVLLLAWALGDVIAQCKTADFLAGILNEGLPRWALPALIAILSHVISYACGSSFGTMGIILPLVGPVAMKVGGSDDKDYLLHCVASVLGGSIFGNLCSPIADTSILTVLATGCDLQAHIATVTPYALLAAAVALFAGSIPVAAGLYGPLTALAVGTAVLGATVWLAGEPSPP